MSRLVAYVRRVFADPPFFRVCMVFWGAPFLALALWFGAFEIRPPSDGFEWFGVVLLIGLGCATAFLIYLAFCGSEKSISKAADWMGDGGDWLGILFVLAVVLLAFPFTILLRAFFAPSK